MLDGDLIFPICVEVLIFGQIIEDGIIHSLNKALINGNPGTSGSDALARRMYIMSAIDIPVHPIAVKVLAVPLVVMSGEILLED
jgi:hypothetical protein